MHKDLSQTSGLTTWSKENVLVVDSGVVNVDETEVITGYSASIVWDFVITDQVGVAIRSGEIRTAITGGDQGESAVPHSIIESPPIGAANNISIDVRSTFGPEIYLRVTNSTGRDIYASVTARKMVVPWVPLPLPMIQLTIVDLPAGESFMEFDADGVYELVPDFYLRSPRGQSDEIVDDYFWTGTIDSSGEGELWRHGTIASTYVEGSARVWFQGYESTYTSYGSTYYWGSSQVDLSWVYNTTSGTYRHTTSVRYQSSTAGYGYLRDQVLGGSHLWGNGTTISWQRLPGQAAGLWGNY